MHSKRHIVRKGKCLCDQMIATDEGAEACCRLMASLHHSAAYIRCQTAFCILLRPVMAMLDLMDIAPHTMPCALV